MIHPDRPYLPKFASLQTVRAVQSIANNETGFDTWFDALKWMEEEIAKKDFDICLIGAGAYGMPLAAFCKRIGKVGIHIGGRLQLLFGVRGKRWDYRNMYNDNWVSPYVDERPKNLSRVEDGCYW